jgi:hypothetical protein
MSKSGLIDTEWENSFTQILSRTKTNLNRINQRYAPTSASVDSLPTPPNYGFDQIGLGRGSTQLDGQQQSQNAPRYNNYSNLQNHNPVSNIMLDQSVSYSKPSGNMNNNQDVLYSLMERIARLEETQQSSSTNAHRLLAVEKSLADLTSNLSASFHDMKEVQRNILSLQNKTAVSSGVIEVIQHDNDSKRSVISKMDSWIRQGEVWREDVDEKISTLTKLTKAQDRYRAEQRDLLTDNVTKFDLEQLRDKVS